MKRGIALSGGGTKGSYELGVWKALNELGIDYQIVTGTSIGSINGALMATGDYDRAYELWSTITMEDMMEDGINLTDTIEGMYDQREAIGPFLKKYVKNKGADISPFTAFIETLIEEDKIRKSKTDFGLVTVHYSRCIKSERQRIWMDAIMIIFQLTLPSEWEHSRLLLLIYIHHRHTMPMPSGRM